MFTFPFKVGPKKVGLRGQQLKYVARPFYSTKLSEADILTTIVRNYDGLNKGELFSALDAIVNEFRNQLFSGHPVKLMSLGTFRISFNSESHDTPDGFTSDSIKNPRIIFIPDKSLRDEMKNDIVFEEYVQ